MSWAIKVTPAPGTNNSDSIGLFHDYEEWFVQDEGNLVVANYMKFPTYDEAQTYAVMLKLNGGWGLWNLEVVAK